MTHFTKATKAEIQEKAFTMPEYEALLSLIPEDLPMETVFYDYEYFMEEELDKIVEPLCVEITNFINERFPFFNIFGLTDNMRMDYLNNFYEEVYFEHVDDGILANTELEYLETLLYKKLGELKNA